MIELSNTPLNGLKIIQTKHFCDERGVFHKFFSKTEFEILGLESDFKEAYYSINKKKMCFVACIFKSHQQSIQN